MAAVTNQLQATDTAASLGSQAVTAGLIVSASPRNTGPVAIGISSGVTMNSGFVLEPGQAFEFTTDAFSNASTCYAICESGKKQQLSWLAY